MTSSELSRWSVLETMTTPTVCAGVTASYVLRRIAFRAGAFAPGIDESIFRELHASHHGRTLHGVERWLVELGYRVAYRRVVSPTAESIAWVNAGRGYRGAVVPISALRAVGLVVENEPSRDPELVVIDPSPRSTELRRELDADLGSAGRSFARCKVHDFAS
jgi:surface antigen